jgi:hypothetical protein
VCGAKITKGNYCDSCRKERKLRYLRDYYHSRRAADETYKNKESDRARARKYHKIWYACADLPEKERVERRCLRCDRKFMAQGRFNRICPTCTRVNEGCWDPSAYGAVIT